MKAAIESIGDRAVESLSESVRAAIDALLAARG
jgi:hypothetical protein